MRKFLSILAAFLTSACAQTGVAAVNAPTYFTSTEITRDIAFADAEWAKLDIYRPENTNADSSLPVIVFFYGGRWQTGSRRDYRFVGTALAKQGYIVVIPDYRKYPDVKFPTFVDDGAQAVSWTIDHIKSYGGDGAQINIIGHSAGAHTGALLAADKTYLKKYDKDASKSIRSFVGLAGPYDFTPDEADLRDMFGPPDRYPLMQVPTFIDGNQPPMLLLWGEDDQYVGAFNHEKLSRKIHDRGGCVIVKTYPKIDHIWILGSLSWLGKSKSHIADDIVHFINDPTCVAGQPS